MLEQWKVESLPRGRAANKRGVLRLQSWHGLEARATLALWRTSARRASRRAGAPQALEATGRPTRRCRLPYAGGTSAAADRVQESLSVTVRLNTGAPGRESRASAQKYPTRSNCTRVPGAASARAGSQ